MSKIISIDSDGVTHVFESELKEFIECNQWIKENKSEEEYEHWTEQSNLDAKSTKSIQLYIDWLVTNKITHTVTYPTGKVITTVYSDLEK